MTEGTLLPSGSKFRGSVVYASIPTSLVGLVIVLSCLYSILDLTAAEWGWFFGSILAYTAVVSYPNLRLQWRMMAPIVAYLDGGEEQNQREKIRRDAFACVIDLPRRAAIVAAAGWVLPAVVVNFVMAIRFEPWGIGESFVLLVAGLAAAFVNGTITMFVSKGIAQPTRDALAAELPDAAERRSLIRTLSLRTKVIVCVTGVALVPVIFSVLLARSESAKAFETFTLNWQRELLDAVQQLANAEGGAPDYEWAEQVVLAPDTILPAPVDVSVIDVAAAGAEPERSSIEAHVRHHIRRELDSGVSMGSSLGLPSSSVFSWSRLDGERILVATTPRSALGVEAAGSWMIYCVLVMGALTMASGLAFLMANDVGRTTRALQGEADRMASGDLRQGHVLESEDELGDLSRAFEAMGQSLRSTISRVAAAADRVESTAGEMAAVADSVTKVNASQVTGIREAARSMEAIDSQVKDIADSSQALNISVEESSSTILELGAAGEELNDTATVLSTRVGEVSSSIEQMVASVKQVSENTEALSHAAVETSTSMEEMASSMREVDTSAEETARLSDVVIASAEKGQAKVRQTIDGMNAIREATETAEGVIRNLGQRTKEIGAIVDVIDDVADETNLLALNAAIIAAQAGEHGRAFSVVADEIKDLADRTLASTKEIGNLISSVQDESSNAIGAIERGTQSVAEGVDLSAEAGVSLEEITRASRDSGTRISGIVTAVREQAKAAAHVAELMERVRGGVDEIRAAASEQEKGNEVVYRGAVAMREVAQQVRGTTEEQARGSGRIRESVDGVRDAVEQINSALQEQSTACRSVVEFLEEVSSRTQSNEQSAGRMGDATKALLREAEELREDVHRFRI